MQFISFFKPASNNPAGPTRAHIAEMDALIAEQTKAGKFIAAGGFLPASQGLRVKKESGKITVDDGAGPATENLGGGFGMLQADSREEMIALITRFLDVAGDGECDVRVLMDGPPQE